MAINCHTYNLVIRGKHLSVDEKKALGGAELMNAVSLKCRDWIENKIPSIREAREEEEAEARAAIRRQKDVPISDEDKAKLAERVKALVEIVGRTEAFAALGHYEFYRTIVDLKQAYTKRIPRFMYDDIMKDMNAAVRAADAEETAGAMMDDKSQRE